MNIYIKRTIKTGAFFLGLAVVLTLASFLFEPKDNTQDAGMEEVFANAFLGEKENTIDVLVTGDSYSYTSTVPPEIWKAAGITSFVSGTNDQSLDYTMAILRRFFKNQSPKVVILEASPIYREISSFELLIANLSQAFPVFRYHDRWKAMNREDIRKRPEYTLTKDYKGYKYYTKIEPAEVTGNMKETDEAQEIPRSCIRYVKKIKKYCEDHGAVLVLMSAPNVKFWDYRHHNGIVRLAGEIGCDYMDLNLYEDTIGVDWQHDTCDKGDHLNHAGAVKSTRFLIGYLTGMGTLEDHRSDPAFADWDIALRKYEKQVRKEGI